MIQRILIKLIVNTIITIMALWAASKIPDLAFKLFKNRLKKKKKGLEEKLKDAMSAAKDKGVGVLNKIQEVLEEYLKQDEIEAELETKSSPSDHATNTQQKAEAPPKQTLSQSIGELMSVVKNKVQDNIEQLTEKFKGEKK